MSVNDSSKQAYTLSTMSHTAWVHGYRFGFTAKQVSKIICSPILICKLSWTCYGELTPYGLQKVEFWDGCRNRMMMKINLKRLLVEFQAAGAQTAKLCDPYKALSTLSHKSETVAEFGNSRTFVRQCGQGLTWQFTVWNHQVTVLKTNVDRQQRAVVADTRNLN